MGNLCSKSSNQPDNFTSPGRVLGAAPETSPKPSSPVPSKPTVSSPGRALGGTQDRDSSDPRSAAARAAEERAAKANKPGGKLQEELLAQKRQTQNQLLQAGSDQERGQRVADANAEVRNWN